MSLFFDIETFEGEPFTLKLETFSVGNATSNYTIHFSGYSQSSDRVTWNLFSSYSNDMMFTTHDRDNDLWSDQNCASDRHKGGWWYNGMSGCSLISPNGIYEGDVTPTYTGILVWGIDHEGGAPGYSKAVKTIEMIIRTRVE